MCFQYSRRRNTYENVGYRALKGEILKYTKHFSVLSLIKSLSFCLSLNIKLCKITLTILESEGQFNV